MSDNLRVPDEKSRTDHWTALKGWWPAVFIAASVSAACFYFSQAAFIGFHDHDWGCFVDAAWRVYRGQKIYTDFLYPSGPGHVYLQTFFYHLMGFGRAAIFWQLVAVNTAAAAAVFLAFYRKVPLPFCVLAALTEMLFFQWTYPFPYYDYSAHLPGLVAAAWLFRWMLSETERGAFLTGMICGICGMLGIITKINVGAVYALFFAGMLLISGARRRALSGWAAGSALMLALSFLSVSSPRDYFEQVFIYSGSQLNRLVWLQEMGVLAAPFYFLPLLVLAVAAFFFRKQEPKALLFFLGMWFIGCFTRLTSSTFKTADFYFPNAGLYAGAGLYLLCRYRREAAGRAAPAAVLAALFIFSGVTVMRMVDLYRFNDFRIKHKVGFIKEYMMGEIPAERRYYLKSGPFKGWLHLDLVGQRVEDMTRFIESQVGPEESLLVLSSDQILYALAGKDSYRGVPYGWGVDNTAPPPGKLWEQVHRQLIEHPPDWILTYRQPGYTLNPIIDYMHLGDEYLLGQYALVHSWEDRAIFRRKGPGA